MPLKAGLRWPSISILKSISALQMPRRSAMLCNLVTRRTRLPIDLHFQVVDLDNLIPQVGYQRHGQVAVGDGAVIGTLGLGALHIHVNPLMVECGVGKHVDTFLVHGEPLAGTQFLAQMGGKFFVRVDSKHMIVLSF